MVKNENKAVAVIGAGIFGSVVANLLAKNRQTFIFTQREDAIQNITVNKEIKGIKLDPSIQVIQDPEELAATCSLIFPLVRSQELRKKIRLIAPYLKPDHIIIHGIKGLDLGEIDINSINAQTKIDRKSIKTMSEVILEETVVQRVGCFSGPNLAREIADGQLAGTVVASRFDEVIYEGRKALESRNFKVFYSHDIKGVELIGVLKNIMAIASGALHGLGYGENAKAILISRGLAEITLVGRALGFNPASFLGVAGIGDLVATCSSDKSRNFSVGFRIAKGQSIEDILEDMDDVAEGIGTVKIVNGLANMYGFRAPIAQTLYKVLFEGMSVQEGIDFLMHLPIFKDVDFI